MRMLETGEASILARCARELLIRAIQRGDVKGDRVDGRYRVDKESLERWCAQRKRRLNQTKKGRSPE